MGCPHILCVFIVFGTLEMNGSNRGVTQPASYKHLQFGRGRNARLRARQKKDAECPLTSVV